MQGEPLRAAVTMSPECFHQSPARVLPDYKTHYRPSASVFARASRLATEETCHRFPRAVRIPC